ncbi:MAG: hypothetical protein K2K60_05040 [Clostridia bacterium]|nr:hypothetical protein [Clostridia bacterium]
MAKRKAKGGAKSAKQKAGIGRVVVVLLVILFIAGAVCAAGFGSKSDNNKWFKNGDITTWFNSWGKGSAASGSGDSSTGAVLAIGSEGEKLTDGSTYAMGRGLTYFTARDYTNNQEYAPEGEITLTATLSNEYIKAGAFDWSVKFANGSSEWAQGKVANYFVSVTPVEGNSSQAKLKYLAPFAEQIEVTATLRGSSSSDTCTVDCLKPATIKEPFLCFSDFYDWLEMEADAELGSGTVTGDFVLRYAAINMTDNFIGALKNYLTFDIEVTYFSLTNQPFALNGNYLATTNHENLTYAMLIKNFDNYDQAHKEAIYYAWYRAYQNERYNVTANICIDYIFQGVTVSSGVESDYGGTGYTPFGISGSCYGADVSPSVTLNKNVVF